MPQICHPEDIRDTLITFFANHTIVPIVGSGLSCGATACNGTVPNGAEYMQHMRKTLLENKKFSQEDLNELQKCNFSELCDYYEDDENVSEDSRFAYLRDNFSHAELSDSDVRKKFFEIDWPYIYSLNIDDVIENSSTYRVIIQPNRDFRDDVFSREKCLIKLHGDINDIIRYKQSEKILTSKEYALSLERNAPLLNKLRNDCAYQNILFIGCSLDDEIDLKTLTNIPLDYQTKDSLSKSILFVKGEPSSLQCSKYKQYGITDIVVFEDYSDMYYFLSDVWENAQEIPANSVSEYSGLKILMIKGTEKDKNQDYYLWGKGLLDVKNNTISYPYYFIARSITRQILENFHRNKVHLVQGGHISGKSYLLADLYRSIRDRAVYFFDGKARLSVAAMSELLALKDCVVLLDVGAINRDQFEEILLNAGQIHTNSSNFVILINHNDGDTLGLVKWKLQQGIIQQNDIIRYELSNRLSNSNATKELTQINKLLPVVNLPVYNTNRTLLDQLILAERRLNVAGRFKRYTIKIRTSRQLSLLIIFAIKERLFSSDVINFSLEGEMTEAIKKYNPFFERIETAAYEKDASDLSAIKYVLNSKYWLQRELGNFARQSENYPIIAQAYQYIIQKVLSFAGRDEFKRRRLCRNYILFDVMNDIFLDEHKGNLPLIVHIYTQLQELLAWDYNFLHQKAKCFLNYSNGLKQKKDRLCYLNDAKQLSAVALSMVEDRYTASRNERLLISLAHIQYTEATILSEICSINNYSDISALERTIDTIQVALASPYNADDYRRDSKRQISHGIISFLKSASKIQGAAISATHQRVFEEILNTVMFQP